MQDADDFLLKVALPAEWVKQFAEVVAVQADSHGVDGEVAPVEVEFERGMLHVRQCPRMQSRSASVNSGSGADAPLCGSLQSGATSLQSSDPSRTRVRTNSRSYRHPGRSWNLRTASTRPTASNIRA